jgi:hypothetical protein
MRTAKIHPFEALNGLKYVHPKPEIPTVTASKL